MATLGSVSSVSRKLVETVGRHDKDVAEMKKDLRLLTDKLQSECTSLDGSVESLKTRLDMQSAQLTAVEGMKGQIGHLAKMEADICTIQTDLDRVQVDVKSVRTISEALAQDIEDMQGNGQDM